MRQRCPRDHPYLGYSPTQTGRQHPALYLRHPSYEAVPSGPSVRGILANSDRYRYAVPLGASVVDSNTLNFYPDLEFWLNLYPDPGLSDQF